MPWHLALCYEGSELACEERVKKHYGFDTFVLTGLRTKCSRRDWPQTTLDLYAVIDGYVFVDLRHRNFSWDIFFSQTRLNHFLMDQDQLYEVPPEIMRELYKRQSSGEFTDWLTKAREYFTKYIGKKIKIPSGRFEGSHAKVMGVVGDNLVWQLELFGTTIKGSTKLCKIWPKDEEAQEQAAILELHSGLQLYMKKADTPVEKGLEMPILSPFSM